MFRRSCFNSICALEAALGISELELEREDHASSGPCDRVSPRTRYPPFEPTTPKDVKIAYTIGVDKATGKLVYEFP